MTGPPRNHGHDKTFEVRAAVLADVRSLQNWSRKMSGIIYLVGLVVVIMAVLSFVGIH